NHLSDADVRSAHDDLVATDTCPVSDGRRLQLYFLLGSPCRIAVREDARERADDGVLTDLDAAAVVQKDSLMDHCTIANRQLVSIGQINAVVNLHPVSHVVEDVPRQHAAEAQPQP